MSEAQAWIEWAQSGAVEYRDLIECPYGDGRQLTGAKRFILHMEAQEQKNAASAGFSPRRIFEDN